MQHVAETPALRTGERIAEQFLPEENKNNKPGADTGFSEGGGAARGDR